MNNKNIETFNETILNIFTAKFKESGIFIIIKDNNQNIIYPKEVSTLSKATKILKNSINCLNSNKIEPFYEVFDKENNKFYKIESSKYTINNDIFYVDLIEDISKQKHFENESKTDHNTGLYNTRAIIKKIDECIINETNNFSIVMCDIDNFKYINDTYSHSGGDIVLKKIADIFTKIISNQGYVGRYGGDEFILIFKNHNEDQTLKIVKEIINQINKLSIKFDDKIINNISISCGIYESSTYNISSIDDVIKIRKKIFSKADQALYEIKETGKGRAKIYAKKSGK